MIAMEPTDQCQIRLVKDSKLGWRFKMTGNCGEAKAVVEGLSPSKKRYLDKRILKE